MLLSWTSPPLQGFRRPLHRRDPSDPQSGSSGFPAALLGFFALQCLLAMGALRDGFCQSPPDSTHSVSTLSTKRLFRKRPLPPPPGGFHSGTLLSFQPSGFCSPRLAGPVSRPIPPMPFPGPTPESSGPAGSEGLLPPGIGASTTGVSNGSEAHTLLAFLPSEAFPLPASGSASRSYPPSRFPPTIETTASPASAAPWSIANRKMGWRQAAEAAATTCPYGVCHLFETPTD